MDAQITQLIGDAILSAPAALVALGALIQASRAHWQSKLNSAQLSVVEKHTDGVLAAMTARQDTRDMADAAARLADGDAAREKAMRLPEGS
jgi:hypothetical protein